MSNVTAISTEPATAESASLLPVATGRRTRQYVVSRLVARWPLLAATLVAMVAQSALALLGPVAIGWVTQAVVEDRPTTAIVGPVVVLAAGGGLGALMTWAAGALLARVVLPEVAGLRKDVVGAALAVPVAAVEAGGIGDLVSRVCDDTERISDVAQEALGDFGSSALTIVISLLGLATLDWRLALAALVAVPVQAGTLRWYLRVSRPIYANGRAANGRRAAALLGTFAALPTVRALRLGSQHGKQIETCSEDAMEYEFRAIHVATRFFGRLNVAEWVGLSGILFVAFFLVRAHAVTIGEATTAALLFAGLFGPINTTLSVFDDLQQAGAGLARLVGVVDAVPEPITSGPLPRPPYGIDAVGLDFGYRPGTDVLHQVSVQIGPGRQVAVVGTTGSGKSTLAALLCGVREPRRGTISVGGTPLAAIPARARGRLVALISQEPHVFTGTVADNLRLASATASDSDLDQAVADIGARDWIAALPDGLRTTVGAGGHQLTADQAQHLALARLLLLDPAMVVLDEATAEAGSDAARKLDAAARRAIRGRGAVVIAHRLSQAAEADTVIVLDDGHITEQGTHEQLRAGTGSYASLWQSWSQQPS